MRAAVEGMPREPAGTSEADGGERSALPRHLQALVGALQGPAGLGANHDAYLAHPAGEDSPGGAASAQFSATRVPWSRLVVASPVVTEVCHLLADPLRRGGPGLASEFCAAVADDALRAFEGPHDGRRMSDLLATYSSARLQAVDACVIALAERLDLGEVATLDRRDSSW